ncbi:MAG TPA: hypothetical protein VM840_01790, partial [Actinomycetota bacterium]|nr:hypothetical protein [Actinomycetota bacterium]
MPRVRAIATALVVALVAMAAPLASLAADGVISPAERMPLMAPTDADASVSANGSLLLDRQRRIGYQVFALRAGTTAVQSFDLDTLSPVQSRTFPFSIATPRTAGASGEFIQAIDEVTGRLYFGFLALGVFGGVVAIDGPTLTQLNRFRREDAPPTPASSGLCTSVNSCVPSPAGVVPAVAGLEVTPSRLTGTSSKLLLLMEEPKPPGTENNVNAVWVAQWDSETGKQDWIYRVGACGSYQLPSHPVSRYQLGLFQSRRGAAIYTACRGSGGTGQV